MKLEVGISRSVLNMMYEHRFIIDGIEVSREDFARLRTFFDHGMEYGDPIAVLFGRPVVWTDVELAPR